MFSALLYIIDLLTSNRRSWLAHVTARSGADNAKRLLAAGQYVHDLSRTGAMSEACTRTGPKLERSPGPPNQCGVAGRVRPVSNKFGNLLAKVTVAIPRWAAMPVDYAVTRTNAEGYFVCTPTAPMIERNGAAMTDRIAKTEYCSLVASGKETNRRFSEAIVRLSKDTHLELFGDRW